MGSRAEKIVGFAGPDSHQRAALINTILGVDVVSSFLHCPTIIQSKRGLRDITVRTRTLGGVDGVYVFNASGTSEIPYFLGRLAALTYPVITEVRVSGDFKELPEWMTLVDLAENEAIDNNEQATEARAAACMTHIGACHSLVFVDSADKVTNGLHAEFFRFYISKSRDHAKFAMCYTNSGVIVPKLMANPHKILNMYRKAAAREFRAVMDASPDNANQIESMRYFFTQLVASSRDEFVQEFRGLEDFLMEL